MAAGEEHYDALIVGAGFAGIYSLKTLRDDLGLKCLCIDQAGDVGGTWYWNLYPGAMSDTESYVYRYSWDKDDLATYPWKEHYVKQPEVLGYLRHVVEKYDLRRDMRFETRLVGMEWDGTGWRVRMQGRDGERVVRARYVVMGLGLLSKQNVPDIRGIDGFEGEMAHTGKWPGDLALEGKRVGIIGSGSTGIQVISEIGRKVKTLTCFQRHPQYSVPSGDRKVTTEYRQWVNENYDEIWNTRQRIFQENWDKGNGFRFMFGTFNDISTDAEANEGACEFIRSKIDEIVKDPEKARKLKPHDVYARRPLCDGNASSGQSYFEQFNRPNVDIVDLKETPIDQIEAKGIRTGDGHLHELDVLILATGFDAVEGNYNRMRIHGREGKTLKDAWNDGPTSLFGVHVPDFPNFFMINGPLGAFTNQPPAIEAQVAWIASIIQEAERSSSSPVIEATKEGQEGWSELCEKLAADSLFWKAEDNWIFGANIPGKKRCLRFYFGGMSGFHEELRKCVANHYPGFIPFAQEHATTAKM
ncbi:hypothetical protein PRZ48_001676 [Zasmidium cellare]|uniref:Cyclohexanone monooxygenase n=1 Tax=Zasmidium cellare TaxID=395010 RepID=A0ABR0F3L5_ZASCE|nr:hypothetical protein PRZ48_001676 [Zasmidium cellare]